MNNNEEMIREGNLAMALEAVAERLDMLGGEAMLSNRMIRGVYELEAQRWGSNDPDLMQDILAEMPDANNGNNNNSNSNANANGNHPNNGPDALVARLVATPLERLQASFAALSARDLDPFPVCENCARGWAHGGASAVVDRERDIRLALSCEKGRRVFRQRQAAAAAAAAAPAAAAPAAAAATANNAPVATANNAPAATPNNANKGGSRRKSRKNRKNRKQSRRNRH